MPRCNSCTNNNIDHGDIAVPIWSSAGTLLQPDQGYRCRVANGAKKQMLALNFANLAIHYFNTDDRTTTNLQSITKNSTRTINHNKSTCKTLGTVAMLTVHSQEKLQYVTSIAEPKPLQCMMIYM